MPSKNPEKRFRDILENIARIENYTAGKTVEEYADDILCMDAVERCLSRISEAAVKLDQLAEELAAEEEWDNIRGLGNQLRHGYDNINPERIWLMVEEKLPGLKRSCELALKQV